MKKFLYASLFFVTCSCNQTSSEKINEPVKDSVLVHTDSMLLPLENYFIIDKLTAADFERNISGVKRIVTNEEADQGLDQHHLKLIHDNEDVFSNSDYGHPFYIDTKKGYVGYEDNDSRNADKNIRYFLYSINNDLAVIRFLKKASSGWEFLERTNKESHTCLGYPLFSSDSSRIMVASSSIPQRYDEKGFQYFVRKDNKWILKWKILLDDWFASDLHWLTDSSLVCRKVYYGKEILPENYDSIQYLQLIFKNY